MLSSSTLRGGKIESPSRAGPMAKGKIRTSQRKLFWNRWDKCARTVFLPKHAFPRHSHFPRPFWTPSHRCLPRLSVGQPVHPSHNFWCCLQKTASHFKRDRKTYSDILLGALLLYLTWCILSVPEGSIWRIEPSQ